MNERDYLVDRLQRYFHHPDADHEYLTLGDRAAACRNLRDVFAWLDVPGASGTRVDDPDAEFFDTDLEEQVKAFQRRWGHPILDGKVGPNTRSRLLRALLEKFHISAFRRLKRDVKPTVFISYAWADSERVNKLDQWLRDHGVRVIRDVNSFKTGSNIPDNILGVSHLIYGFLTGRGQHPQQRGHLARRLPELATHLGRLEQNYHNHMILIGFMPFLRRSSGTHPYSSVSHVIYVIVAGCMGERWTVQPRYFAA